MNHQLHLAQKNTSLGSWNDDNYHKLRLEVFGDVHRQPLDAPVTEESREELLTLVKREQETY